MELSEKELMNINFDDFFEMNHRKFIDTFFHKKYLFKNRFNCLTKNEQEAFINKMEKLKEEYNTKAHEMFTRLRSDSPIEGDNYNTCAVTNGKYYDYQTILNSLRS
jgi:hypothetical protein